MSDTKNISLNVGESKYIIIPLAIVDDVRLTPADKLVYGLVYSLSQKRGYSVVIDKKWNLNIVSFNYRKKGCEQFEFG